MCRLHKLTLWTIGHKRARNPGLDIWGLPKGDPTANHIGPVTSIAVKNLLINDCGLHRTISIISEIETTQPPDSNVYMGC